jgi:hypothetical protein
VHHCLVCCWCDAAAECIADSTALCQPEGHPLLLLQLQLQLLVLLLVLLSGAAGCLVLLLLQPHTLLPV